MEQGHELLIVEKGNQRNSVLGRKNKRTKAKKETDYPFEFIVEERDVIKAVMAASTRHPDKTESTKRIARPKWAEFAEPKAHQSNMVRLMY
jgi:hypothetical protein